MRQLSTIAVIIATLLILAVAASLVFRPDPLRPLNEADRLFVEGRYHEALAAYQAIAHTDPAAPIVQTRLGMLATIRGEYRDAQSAFAAALGAGLAGDEYALARLYQGALAERGPGYGDARALWALVPNDSPLVGARLALEGESLLHQGEYSAAEAVLRDALTAQPSAHWVARAQVQLALLHAGADPEAALANLTATPEIRPRSRQRPVESLAEPLAPPIDALRGQLITALQAQGDTRNQLLGQILLEQRLYPLASARFDAINPAGPLGQAASAYAAYTRWLAGDRTAGIERLRALVQAHPDEPRARALLALAALASDDLATARAQLEIIRTAAPGDPAVYLAWGQWYAEQRDYIAAAESYQHALDRAAVSERGIYALHLARFYLDTSLLVCEAGLPAARTATQSDPPSAAAWSALAQAQLACGDAPGARASATQAIGLDPRSPEAHYQLGRALATLGDTAGARIALIAAADTGPATPWQNRAETQLAALDER